jgi:hypothetical protein
VKKLVLLILVVFSCSYCYCANDVILCNKVITKESENLMYVLFARDSLLRIDLLNNNRGKLTLYEVNQHMTYFTNRPYKKAGQMFVKDFVKEWKENYITCPPNASFVCFHNQDKGKILEIPIKIKNPQYDEESGRLVFDVDLVVPDEHVHSGNYGEIALFIDLAPVEVLKLEN